MKPRYRATIDIETLYDITPLEEKGFQVFDFGEEDWGWVEMWTLLNIQHRINGPTILYPNGQDTFEQYNSLYKKYGPAEINGIGEERYFIENPDPNAEDEEDYWDDFDGDLDEDEY